MNGISGFGPRFTSDSVGTASRSMIRWSTAHRAASPGDGAMPFSRVTRGHWHAPRPDKILVRC